MKLSIEERCKRLVQNEVVHCASTFIYELIQLLKDGKTEWPDELYTICQGPADDESDPEDPDYQEVFEHWIVSEYLADRLLAKGESVAKDFMGFHIWGRTTTGMAIAYDQVIVDIVSETGYHSGE